MSRGKLFAVCRTKEVVKIDSERVILRDEQPDQPPETIIVSEYDVGEAELESLNIEDDNENFNEKNVVLHESVEDITDPLTDAKYW